MKLWQEEQPTVMHEATKSDFRNQGIDLLRVIAMMMVVAFHFLDEGGVLDNLHKMGGGYEIFHVIRAALFSCVNMFALISGYVGVGRRHRYRSLVGYWLQMVFVTISLTALFSMIDGQNYFTFKRVFLKMFFPITCHANWYMTSYFMLFIFMPLLDRGILSLSKVQYRNVILGAIGLISLARFVSLTDPFKVNSGFSFFWLMILYDIGAYFKLHPVSIKKRWCAVGMLASLLVTYGVSFLFRKNVALTNLYHGNPFLDGYVSPFVLAFALFALLLLSQQETLPCGLWRVVRFIAPTCLGVFLWHINEFSMSVLRTLGRLFDHSVGVVNSLVLYCTLSIGIFLVFSVIEHGRMILFRALGIERWVKRC